MKKTRNNKYNYTQKDLGLNDKEFNEYYEALKGMSDVWNYSSSSEEQKAVFELKKALESKKTRKTMKKTEKIKQNRIQEHFNNVFIHDLSDEDFLELKKLVSDWLSTKLINGVTKKHKQVEKTRKTKKKTTITLDEFLDKEYGKAGTAKRKKADARLKEVEKKQVEKALKP